MENIVEKGEIAHFHLFPQCFLKAFLFHVLQWVHMEERVKRRQNKCDWNNDPYLGLGIKSTVGEIEKILVIPLSHYDHELYESPRIDKLSSSWNSAKFMDRIVTFYELVKI